MRARIVKLENNQYFYLAGLIMLLAYFFNRYLNLTRLIVYLYFVSTFLIAIGIFKNEYKRYYFVMTLFLFILSYIILLFNIEYNFKILFYDFSLYSYSKNFLNFLMFILIPYIFLEVEKYIKYKYPNLEKILKPENKKEIIREDGIIIDLIGFFQAIIFLKLLNDDLYVLQIITLIGFILFVIPRSISIIKDNQKLRRIATKILLVVFITNIYTLGYVFFDIESFKILNNYLKIDAILVYIISYLYFFIFSLFFMGDIIDNRYQ